jgi:small nuclear ribonucleoprotein G
MARVSQPELKRYLDKKVVINIQGGRRVQGTLRGFDVFLNLVVDDTLEFTRPEGGSNIWKEAAQCGTVVRTMMKS